MSELRFRIRTMLHHRELFWRATGMMLSVNSPERVAKFLEDEAASIRANGGLFPKAELETL